MYNIHVINNTKVLLCRNDKTKCMLRCPKCEETKKNCKHSKSFDKPESVWRHLYQSHSRDANEYPSLKLSIDALEQISITLANGYSICKLELPNKLGMVVT